MTDAKLIAASTKDTLQKKGNPWSDDEIVTLLNIMQEDSILVDIAASKTKEVFYRVAKKMAQDIGSEKTWDQCRIKVKNLKSQYRLIKDRITNIDQLNLEDEETLKQVIADCQGRGIPVSHIKHLTLVKNFISKAAIVSSVTGKAEMIAGKVEMIPGKVEMIASSGSVISSLTMSPSTSTGSSLTITPANAPTERLIDPESGAIEGEEKPFLEEDDDDIVIESLDVLQEPIAKRSKTDEYKLGKALEAGSSAEGYRFMEKFNREMMDQFVEVQRRYTSSYIKWEQDRYRQEQIALEKWRSGAREHEKQMLGVFCNTISSCNSAMSKMLQAKKKDEEEIRKLREILKNKDLSTDSSE